ncbi:MAG: lipid-A-disaccharide synthase [Deltaproteobacteria bacterium]|nr:lipid-A-disaccharide synthase [Candidatus Anaeroferrophillacea bacterium]
MASGSGSSPAARGADGGRSPTILIIAGEDSGDLHGATLARALQRLQPEVELLGVGGMRMAAAGVSLIYPSAKLAVVGITEVLEKLPAIREGRRTVLKILKERRPDLVVLIDFPDFNLYLVAPAVKRLCIPLVYYISPQVWAWRRRRVHRIRRLVDRMLVILPFEAEFYRRYGVEVTYVGHPLVDEFIDYQPPSREKRPYVALLPGSRHREVRRLFPVMLEAAAMVRAIFPAQEFLVPVAPSLDERVLEEMIPADLRSAVRLVRESLPACLPHAAAAVVTSGTATLETALAGVPMVVVYRLAPLSYRVGRMLISVPFISLVNLVAGRKVVTELIQDEVTSRRLFDELHALMTDRGRYERMVADLVEVKRRLGSAGGADRAATEIIRLLPGTGRSGGAVRF